MSTNWIKDITEMHDHYNMGEAFRKLDVDKLKKLLQFRIDFLQEELDELKTAENAEDVVDALIDLCVVAIGTLDAFAVDAEEAWNVVLKANMAKEPGVNASRPNPLGLPDLIKPHGWESPSHADNVGWLDQIFD